MKKIFLDWNKNLVSIAVEKLAEQAKEKPPDLSHICIVTQTKYSGKRLKLALARHFINGFIPPLFVTPDFFLSLCLNGKNIPSHFDLIFFWIKTLRSAPKEILDVLKIKNTHSIDILSKFAEDFCDFRRSLSENGHTITSIAEKAEQFGIEEVERWKAMAELEKLYLKNLEENNFEDPEIIKINSSLKCQEINNVAKIILLAVCDPIPLVMKKIEQFSEKMEVEIWIHAPIELADAFDGYGRPLPEKWENSKIEINLENIYIEGNPSEQVKLIVNKFIERTTKSNGNCSIVILNKDLSNGIERVLLEKGVSSYNPAGYIFSSFSIFYFFKSFYEFLSTNSFESFANLLRNSSFLFFLKSKYSLSILELLDELDKFQNESLPQHVDLENVPSKYKNIRNALSELQRISTDFKKSPISLAIKNLVVDIFSCQQNVESYKVNSLVSLDNILNEVKSSIDEIKGSALEESDLPAEEKFYIFLNCISRKSLYPEVEKGIIPLSGWLETQFNTTDEIILCGMNEGFMPESLSGDIFLPDSVREKIGLRNNRQRFARDVYLMQSILKSRKKEKVSYVLGKIDCNNEPIMPSRLLFLSDSEELVKRAEKIFKPLIRKKYEFLPSTPQWKLKISEKKFPDTLSISDFKSYIICPFRFYLKKVLKMQEYNEKIELDNLDFGEIMHKVLENFAKEAKISNSQKEEEIKEFLFFRLDNIISHRYGKIPNASVLIQVESMKNRLAKFAEIQSKQNREGWKIIEAESPIESTLSEMKIKGRIDRIDISPDGKLIRIIDYKTSDGAENPVKAHIGNSSNSSPDFVKINNGTKVWLDLQLPLYAFMLKESNRFEGKNIKCAYFNLPKALEDSKIDLWDELSDIEISSAKNCAEKIIERIKNGIFWPPSENIKYDDFERIFPDQVSKIVEELKL